MSCCDEKSKKKVNPPLTSKCCVKSYFDELQARVDLAAGSPVSVASVQVGTAASPSRWLVITATFSASSSQVPKFVDFILRLDTTDLPGGAELSFTAATLGQSGSITKRIQVSAGAHTINLEAIANAAGVSIDPVVRVQRDHAALSVLEIPL